VDETEEGETPRERRDRIKNEENKESVVVGAEVEAASAS
jgi:hypothetical protein